MIGTSVAAQPAKPPHYIRSRFPPNGGTRNMVNDEPLHNPIDRNDVRHPVCFFNCIFSPLAATSREPDPPFRDRAENVIK